jgi:hypothetical protein
MKTSLRIGFVLFALGTVLRSQAFAADLAAPTETDQTPKESNCDGGLDGYRGGPGWTIRAGGLIMERSQPNDAVLVTNSFSPGGDVLLNASDFDFGFAGGFEIDAIRHNVFGTSWDPEVRLFSLDGWSAQTDSVSAPAGSVVQYATPIGNPFYPGNISASLASELKSVEFNVRRQTRDWLTVLAGVRYVELNEQGLAILQDIGPGLNLATHAIDADNHLWGGQIGADATALEFGRFQFGAVGKAGIYSNDCGNRVAVSQMSGPSFGSDSRENHTSFVGELGATGTCAITERWSGRAAYQLFWVDGVALASDQVAVSDPARSAATVDSSGTAFYHGVFVGLEYSR